MGTARPGLCGVGTARPGLGGVGTARPGLGGVGTARPSLGDVGTARPALGRVGTARPGLDGVESLDIRVFSLSNSHVCVLHKSPSITGVTNNKLPSVSLCNYECTIY